LHGFISGFLQCGKKCKTKGCKYRNDSFPVLCIDSENFKITERSKNKFKYEIAKVNATKYVFCNIQWLIQFVTDTAKTKYM